MQATGGLLLWMTCVDLWGPHPRRSLVRRFLVTGLAWFAERNAMSSLFPQAAIMSDRFQVPKQVLPAADFSTGRVDKT